MAAVNESGLLKGLETIVSTALWGWIDNNLDKDVFTLRVWIIRKTFKVSDLLPFAELLLGPNPATPSAVQSA
jgi:hypothetical protein